MRFISRGHLGCFWFGLLAVFTFVSHASANSQAPRLEELQLLTEQTVQEYHAGRIGVATAIAKKVAVGAKLRYGAKHLRYAQALNNWALFQGWNGQLTAAEKNFRFAISIVEKFPGNQSGELIELMNNLAWVTLQQCQIRETQSLFAKAFDLTTKFYGDHHPKTAMVRVNISNLDSYLDNPGSTGLVTSQKPKANDISWVLRRCVS